MLNKPKYTLFKNTSYALSGLVDILKTEKSLRLQILLFVILTIIVWSLPLTLISKFVLQAVSFLPIYSEIVNSAIERVVDLVTTDYHILAKKAKDVGATLVFISFSIEFVVWVITLYMNFFS
ncbi:diacylglycerol kinase [Candidatus Francisella endociliophora]|uniref:Diacylglycerol kinase n=1 Tax=Candidatus Francisella endociliophora TaxID=653937 RepID=A0A097EQ48_9GAMM|nr:diacylglycerol kinase [Francisella sp. FSC1006]AIT09666.1 diacylglycerol kinase [Francisella sp. FSC1006]